MLDFSIFQANRGIPRARCGAVSAALLIALGCGGSGGPDMGTVRGTVTVQDQSLTRGMVNLYDKATGVGIRGEIKEDGTFAIEEEVKAGSYVVFVRPPDPPPPIMESADAPYVKVEKGEFPVPQKYQSSQTSDLEIEVKPGENEIPIVVP